MVCDVDICNSQPPWEHAQCTAVVYRCPTPLLRANRHPPPFSECAVASKASIVTCFMAYTLHTHPHPKLNSFAWPSSWGKSDAAHDDMLVALDGGQMTNFLRTTCGVCLQLQIQSADPLAQVHNMVMAFCASAIPMLLLHGKFLPPH